MMSWCPIEKVDDLVVLGMVFMLACIFAGFGQWEAAQNIASAFAGAAAMYVKGQQ